MKQQDFFEETLQKKIYRLEKRMRWVENDIVFLREMYKRMFPNKPIPSKKIEQLDLFVG